MKKAKVAALAACLTILSAPGFAASGAAAITIVTDLSNFAFYNGCTDEYVLTGPGSYVHGVIRKETPLRAGFSYCVGDTPIFSRA